MAEVNNETIQQQQAQEAPYKVYGTNQVYTGMVVNIGNKVYTTTGGTLEGNSVEVVPNTPGGGNQNVEEDLPTMSPMNQPSSGAAGGAANTNPITRLFVYAPGFYEGQPRYYRSDTGQEVELYSQLHEHADGTVMTEHTMNNSVIVTTTPPNSTTRMNQTTPTTGGQNTTGGGMNQQQAPPAQTGGGMGGGGSY